MANEGDDANDLIELSEALGVAEIRKKAAQMSKGIPGECEKCEEDWTRIVNGACCRCRDKYNLL